MTNIYSKIHASIYKQIDSFVKNKIYSVQLHFVFLRHIIRYTLYRYFINSFLDSDNKRKNTFNYKYTVTFRRG